VHYSDLNTVNKLFDVGMVNVSGENFETGAWKKPGK